MWVAVLGGGLILVLVARRTLFGRSRAVVRFRSGMMHGKTVIVTGASSGIGKATAAGLLNLSARVIMACRDMARAQQAATEIREHAGPNTGELIIKHLDLTSLRSVRAFCKEIMQEEQRIDVVINNAGVYRCPYTITEDGFELQFGVNHLAHFLLTLLLMDLLRKSSPSRVLLVSSKLYKYGSIDFDDPNAERSYDATARYSQSKLANLLFTRELARRTEGSGVTVNALSPGMVRTDLGRHVRLPLLARPLLWVVSRLFFKSPEEGAETPLYLACSPEVEHVTGKFFSNCQQEALLPKATDDETARRLWELSESAVGLRAGAEGYCPKSYV